MAWGAYVRLHAVAHTHHAGPAGLAWEINPGLYWTVADGHQVLLEYDIAVHPDPGAGERQLETGGAALGYNLTLSAALELVTQVYVGLQSTEVGVLTGFVATLDR